MLPPQANEGDLNAQVKIMWHFNFQTDHALEATKPGITVVDKETINNSFR